MVEKMESLQIRLPKKILEKIDQLVKSGIYRSRSEVLRQAVQEYIIRSNYNGIAPFIVGPYPDNNFKDALNIPLDELIPPKNEIEEIKKRFKDFKVDIA